ncbi:unnamed protein product [Rhizoctonia solani]|nr:unnamed protein product [Rhizoctonia solani]
MTLAVTTTEKILAAISQTPATRTPQRPGSRTQYPPSEGEVAQLQDEGEGEGEGEVEAEAEDDGRDGDDESGAEIVGKEYPGAEGSGGAVSATENKGDANEGYDGGVEGSDLNLAPTKSRQRHFFGADGGLFSPAGSESERGSR